MRQEWTLTSRALQGRDANRNLQRSLKAARLRERLPAAVQQLAGAATQWQDEHGGPFAYNGRPLLDKLHAMLEEVQEEAHERAQHSKKQVECWNCPGNGMHEKRGSFCLWRSLQQEGGPGMDVGANAHMQHLDRTWVQGGRRGSDAGSAAKGGGIAFGRRQDVPAPAPPPSDRTPGSAAKAPQGRAPGVPALPLGSAQRTGVPSLATVCSCLLTRREKVGWPCARISAQCTAVSSSGMLHTN